MRALGVTRFRKRGDRHRAFALAVDLRESVPEHLHRMLAVLHVHRAAAVDNGLQVRRVGMRSRSAFHQPLYHGRCGEEAHTTMRRDQGKDFGGVEVAALGNHLRRASGDMGAAWSMASPGATVSTSMK